jgi:DNA polymerase III subunit delta'
MLAKALNCTNAEPGDFCETCSNCRKIDAGTHPDLVMVSLEDDATQIKIEQIRHVLGLLELHPLEGRNKIFMIDPANLVNTGAANALLKGLEEPPENSFFFLMTVNVHELLLTVRSRCQVYNFTPLTLDEIRQHGITDELAVRWSQGSIGRARALDMTRLKGEREVVMDFLETVVGATEEHFQDLLAVSAELGRAKQEFESRMDLLAVLIADVFYLKEGVGDKLINIDLKDRLQKVAGKISDDRMIQMAEFLRLVELSLKTNVNRQMLMDALAVTGNETAAGWLL